VVANILVKKITMIDINLLLSCGASYKKVSAHDIIFSEGSTCTYYYQLVTGRVRWINYTSDGKEYLQSVIEEGECFGELPLFDAGGYAATAIADVDSLLIRLNISAFHQLLIENPDIHFKFSKLLAHRLRFKFFILKEMAFNDPAKRVAALFHYLKSGRQHICGTCNQIKLTRQQIADMTGLRVETVIRVVRNMHTNGELKILRGKIYFNDMTPVIMNEQEH
jgi:CRP/FNR family transcriptional regulator, cyclic AMP receptor protein